MSFRLVLGAYLILAAGSPAAAQVEAGKGVSPVPAAQEQPSGIAPAPMRIEVDEKTLEGEDAYMAVFETLTPAQRVEQEVLDKQFFQSMAPIMDIYELGGKLMYCLNSNLLGTDHAGHVRSFKAYQTLKSMEQEEMWKKHRQEAGKVAYIEHALMDSHYSYIQAIQKAAAEQMVTQTGKAGGYAGTDCAQVQKTLEIAQKQVAAPPKSGTIGSLAK